MVYNDLSSVSIDEYYKDGYRTAVACVIGKLKLYYSYSTVIAFRYDGTTYLDEQKYSRTTSKHRNSIHPDVTLEHDIFIRKLADCLRMHQLL